MGRALPASGPSPLDRFALALHKSRFSNQDQDYDMGVAKIRAEKMLLELERQGYVLVSAELLPAALTAFNERIGDGAKVILWRGQEDQDAVLILAALNSEKKP